MTSSPPAKVRPYLTARHKVRERIPGRRHFLFVKTENAAGDAFRLYQAILPHLHSALWNDVRNARTLAWMVSGLVLSQSVSIPSWLPHIHSQATVAQNTERRCRLWLENPAIDPGSIYGPLIIRALREWGARTP